MPDTPEKPGCILEPEPAGMASIEPLLGAAPLPAQYIVPSWRDCFTENFEPIPDKIRPRILNQGPLDSCVGHGTSIQKSAQEGVLISPRDIFRQAKRLDGYGLAAFGTTLSAAQDALSQSGAAEDTLVPRDPAMGRDAYLGLGDVNADLEANRKKHRSKSAYYVPRTLIRETMLAYGFPLVTSSGWYPQDNAIGADGIMRLPVTSNPVGHCFASIGWINRVVDGALKSCLVMVNSFGAGWGAVGLFFVPLDGTENRLQNAHVSIDIEPSLAAILAQYNGRNVKVLDSPDHWRIEGGKRRKYGDEIVWWAHGNLFGIDTYDIDADDIDVIPLGLPMSIDEAPFKTRELVRQIRQHYGQN